MPNVAAMRPQVPETGWELVEQREAAPALFGALVALEADEEYTRSDIADAADVPLKTLYLADAMEDLVDVGALSHIDEEGEEATFVLNADSPVVQAAREFDDVVAEQLSAAKAD
jgi:hypothetical protein